MFRIIAYSIAAAFLLVNPLHAAALPKTGWILPVRNCGQRTFFLNNKTGWIFSSHSTEICRTDDSGVTVERQDTDILVSSIVFLDEKNGWAAGSIEEREGHTGARIWGTIRATEDGGRTWKTQFTEFMGSGGGLTGIFFVSPSVGWAVGSRRFILHTVDGGKHWTHQDSGLYLVFNEVYFSDEKHGVIAGDRRFALGESSAADAKSDAVILYTDDGGKTWRSAWHRLPALVVGLNFVNDRIGFASAETLETSLLLTSIDGGKTWSETKLKDSVISAPYFADRESGLIGIDDNKVIVTRDGGKTWSERSLPTNQGLWHILDILKSKKQ